MDLIDICERAKEAGIDVEIRININDIPTEPTITIQGSTRDFDYYKCKRYAIQYTLSSMKESKNTYEYLIKRATDEIIDNLCPKEITEGMWNKAINYLYSLIRIYGAMRGYKNYAYESEHTLKPLRRRIESGERTRELYDKIMALG